MKAQQCLGCILEQKYNPVSMSRYWFLALKGSDRMITDLLISAGKLINLVLCLVGTLRAEVYAIGLPAKTHAASRM